MHALAGPRTDSPQVGLVAHQIGGPRQLGPHLGGGPPVRAGAESDDDDLAGLGRIAHRRVVQRPGHHHHREVRHRRRVDVRDRCDLLGTGGRALDVPGAIGDARGVEGVADLREVASQLHDRRGVTVPQAAHQFGGRQRAGQHGQRLLTLDQRSSHRHRRRGHRGHAGNDLGVEPPGEALVHVHVGAVEQRVALGQQRDIAAGAQVSRQHVTGRGVELRQRTPVAAGMVGGLGGDRVHEPLVDLSVAQVRLSYRQRDAAAVSGAVERHHVGPLDRPGRLERDQLAVAGAEAHRPEFPRLPLITAHGLTLTRPARAGQAESGVPDKRLGPSQGEAPSRAREIWFTGSSANVSLDRSLGQIRGRRRLLPAVGWQRAA